MQVILCIYCIIYKKHPRSQGYSRFNHTEPTEDAVKNAIQTATYIVPLGRQIWLLLNMYNHIYFRAKRVKHACQGLNTGLREVRITNRQCIFYE